MPVGASKIFYISVLVLNLLTQATKADASSVLVSLRAAFVVKNKS